jgi:hypothetical protein
MPKPLIDESDPDISRLNEILVDFITKNLDAVPGRALVFVDVTCLILSPLTFLFAFLNSAFILFSFLLIGLFLSLYLELFSVAYAIFMSVLFAGVFSKQVRNVLFQMMFHAFNFLIYGYPIKLLARGYQSNEPISHRLLISKSFLFSLLGGYVETLNTQKRIQYYKYIEVYQESRYKNKENFEEMVLKYWSENIK